MIISLSPLQPIHLIWSTIGKNIRLRENCSVSLLKWPRALFLGKQEVYAALSTEPFSRKSVVWTCSCDVKECWTLTNLTRASYASLREQFDIFENMDDCHEGVAKELCGPLILHFIASEKRKKYLRLWTLHFSDGCNIAWGRKQKIFRLRKRLWDRCGVAESVSVKYWPRAQLANLQYQFEMSEILACLS